jgi:transcriptional regulator with XRE-family HTH domain
VKEFNNMGILFYGDYLKKVRKHAGLSQEKLAEGIINLQSLNRIENNRAGISPGTFQALTSKCGAPTEVFPLFINWDDFDCFYELYKADTWLESWQISKAYTCLTNVENKDFAGNLIYYQKWLYLCALLHLRNGGNNYCEINDILQYALRITKQNLEFEDIKHDYFTVTEILVITAIAEVDFMQGKMGECLTICTQLATYLENTALSYFEKTSLLLGVKKVYVLYLIQNKEYAKAMDEADELRNASLLQTVEKHIIEATFLLGVTKYINGDKEQGILFIKTAYYSGNAIESQFARVGNNILRVLGIEIEELKKACDLCGKQEKYLFPDIGRKLSLQKVECDYYSDEVITLGKLIHQKRVSQKLSLKKLCQGLCSTSALSKIENDTLQPDIFLSRALIQRLGMSDEPFTFFASDRETKQYSLERKITGVERYELSDVNNILNEMKKEVTAKDIIFEQFYNNNLIFYGDMEEKNIYILENIRKTLPDFKLEKITDYRLSKNELSYIISYCMMLRKEESTTKAIKGLYILLDYINQEFVDDLLKNTVIGIILATLVSALKVQQRNAEILELIPKLDKKIVYGHTHCLPTIYANITDICSEENNPELFYKYYMYAYYLFELHKNDSNNAFIKNTEKRIGHRLDI